MVRAIVGERSGSWRSITAARWRVLVLGVRHEEFHALVHVAGEVGDAARSRRVEAAGAAGDGEELGADALVDVAVGSTATSSKVLGVPTFRVTVSVTVMCGAPLLGPRPAAEVTSRACGIAFRACS